MDAETLSGRSADERGRESAGGRKLLQRCAAVPRGRFKRDQMVSAIFGDGIGARSEPDGRVSQAEAGGPSGLDSGADRSLSGDHLGGAAEFASRTGRLGERRRDLALSAILRPHPQEADAGGRRAVEALPGQGGSAQAGLHRRDLDEDQHVARMRLGSQWPKGAGLGSLRPLGNLDIHRCSSARPDRRPLGPGRTGERRRPPAPCRNAAGSDARPRRHRHHGQPRQPQNRSGARGDPRRRRAPAVPSALQSRSRPDRAGVRQTQALPAKGPAADSGRPLEKHRLNSEDIQTPRMRELPRELRICSWSN